MKRYLYVAALLCISFHGAWAVGRSLAADYIVTGTMMETTNTYIIFSRLLTVTSCEVESAAQVVIAK